MVRAHVRELKEGALRGWACVEEGRRDMEEGGHVEGVHKHRRGRTGDVHVEGGIDEAHVTRCVEGAGALRRLRWIV